MKKQFTGLIAASMLAFSTSASGFDSKEFTVEEAEQQIMKSCIEDKDNSKAQCVCVLGGLKKELPKDDYQLMMNIITFAMNGEFGAIWDYAVEHDIGIMKLKRFGDRLEEVGNKLDKDCDNPDVNFEISI